MSGVSEFLAMGGYAGFVWSAYGIVALVLAGVAVVSRRELRARQREIAVLEAASLRRRARGGDGAP